MSDQGFTDLRLNGGGSSAEHSIWPSFADMMSVVAMIFMLTMVVLVISNWDLVEQLQKALEVEQRLSMEAEESAKRNARLATSLSDKESKLSYLQMQIINLQTEKEEQKKQLDDKQQQLLKINTSLKNHQSALGKQREINLDLGMKLRDSQNKLRKIETKNQELESVYQESKQKQEKLSTQLSGLKDEFTLVQSRDQQKDQDLMRLRQTIDAMQIQINDFQERNLKHQNDYASLKKKYERLLRPARSSKGKKVVEVTYIRQDQTATIKLRKPKSEQSIEIDKSGLIAYLDRLKTQFPRSIYIKVVFPKGSFISHEEAWRFTSELLSKYDYYYQD